MNLINLDHISDNFIKLGTHARQKLNITVAKYLVYLRSLSFREDNNPESILETSGVLYGILLSNVGDKHYIKKL